MEASTVVGAVLVVVLLGSATAFAVSPGSGQQLSPATFDDTLATGLTGVDVQRARAAGVEIPRAQVFFAQFRYVVGYYGVESAVSSLADPTTSERFGQPLAVFVTDFSGTEPRLTERGLIELRSATFRGWTRASEAVFVVGSRARTPGGPAIVPFSDPADARSFADEYGGTVRQWTALADVVDPPESWLRVRDRRVEEGTAWADRTVAEAAPLTDRPVSVVVGEDAPTLAAAVEQAPPNTTVALPAGTHETTNLLVDKPVTIRGMGADATVIDGGGTGSVVTVASPGVAVTDLAVEGVGDRNLGNLSRGNTTGWDAKIKLVYGYGDAAIRFRESPGSLVRDVAIDTPSNGVILLNSTASVVDDVRVDGAPEWQDGFMGVLPMHSRVVVQDTRVDDGRDGVYTHRADGTVIRNSRFAGMRFGVHEMYTSDTLLANNTVRNASTGIIVMTRPSGNTLVDNDVRHSDAGITTAGSATIATGNVVVDNGRGLSIGTSRSTYAENVLAYNGIGIREETLLPTSDVFANDIVGNDQYVDTGRGVQLLWAEADRGNYWGDVPGLDRNGDGVVDRPFRPTGALDVAAARGGGAALLADSPAVNAARAFQRAVPGLRPSGVLDPAPLVDPVHPDQVDRIRATNGGGPPEGETR